jgi:hypothetical protein
MITADRRCEDVRMIQPRIAARLPLFAGREPSVFLREVLPERSSCRVDRMSASSDRGSLSEFMISVGRD